MAINIITVIAVMRCRRVRNPAPSSATTDTNNHITPNPAYATIERTYSEIGPYNEYETPMRHNPNYETKTVYSEIKPEGALSQQYASLETSRKTYETTGRENPQYDVASMMTSHQDYGFDSHPYDEAVEMSSRRNTNSFA